MAKFEALEWKFCLNLGSRMANFVKFMIFVERGLKELKHAEWSLRELLREREKGVLRAAHPCTPFDGEYPPGFKIYKHDVHGGGGKEGSMNIQ